ncbi:MAG: hypothetical protein ACHQAR_01055 [Steroidobacterales bacterium]
MRLDGSNPPPPLPLLPAPLKLLPEPLELLPDVEPADEEVTVTVAEPDWFESAIETAVTVTMAGDGTVAGAV